ncbi:DeoR/GlpR family DNA-binding transcription regulator [Qingshengfaniella alkalisoli]|uniref:DeoR/GlpR transcriptional regulator n=1 Tax=Qingshengfaniella alkalisoli TaxID=2599296 RepID=A0A5B8IY43_9RHOB|nr:DeoR/GlpR family DNA-binding transcription regulator [Qingshengfaniella alkalisoli]QDY70523.1 DeoR/GlpR transcriptional regulator [Qingshengfaniella alkalisoli]
MRKADRQDRILDELRWKPHVRANELAARFGVSTETIRRDLKSLSEAGMLERAYGGASPLAPGGWPTLDQRKLERVDEREQVAALAETIVSDGDTLMVDAGSSTLAFARQIASSGKRLRILTNSLQVAAVAGQSPKIDVKICPGDFLASEAAAIGPETVDFVFRHNVSLCVLGASALNEDGISETVPGFAPVKRAMIQASERAVFLLDHSKFGRAHLDRVAAPRPGMTLCLDKAPPRTLNTAWIERGAEILVTRP